VARDLIQKLLVKDPTKRLGHDDKTLASIRKHPFFKELNWAALVQHKVEPAIKPFSGQVNARDVHDIDRFDQADTRRVVLTEADQMKFYANFDHTMSHHWQEEILASVYDMVTVAADRAQAKVARRAASYKRSNRSMSKFARNCRAMSCFPGLASFCFFSLWGRGRR
jgi:serine/threonine protein kinase